MNPWLAHFAELLDLIRKHGEREPTDADRRRVFAAAVSTGTPTSTPGQTR